MIADIAQGHDSAAEIVWLIAVIVAGLAAVSPLVPRSEPVRYPLTPILGWAAVALIALGLLLL